MTRDFVGRLRMPWARWFLPTLRRRGVRVMALELCSQTGPDDGDWRGVDGEPVATLRGRTGRDLARVAHWALA